MRFAGTQISNFMDNDSFDNISKTAAKSRSQERMAYDQSEGLVDQADINAEATIQAAKYGASATRAEGAAAGQSSMFAGLGNMASGIAGGIANMGGTDLNTAVDRTSLGHGIPGSVGGNGKPMYGPAW